jgi:endonuclease-3 related protein
MSSPLLEIYRRLWGAFGPQGWWPGETAFEVLVGAVLVQNTAWKNVERAIGNLREANLLDPHALGAVALPDLAELIRPAGYFRLKARRLKNLLDFVLNEHGGSLDAMFAVNLPDLREQLLRVNGVGPETADSILLYAGQLPTFVVDTYTARVLKRHGWIEPEAGYHAIKEYFESNLDGNVELFNEYHALLVRVGHLHCRKTPKCEECPLNDLLPEGGPVELR